MIRSRPLFILASVCMILAQLFGDVFAGEKASGLNFSCRSDNDLYQALVDGGALYPRFDTPMAAVEAAEVGSGVLILADEYPAKPTAVETALFDAAAKKKLRLYVEYPSSLPDIPIGESKEDRLLRGVVLSNIFGESLPPMRIVGVNGCRYMPMKAENPHLVLARVAGVGTAVFGLADTQAEPLLFDHPRGDVLVSTSKLSNLVTAALCPTTLG